MKHETKNLDKKFSFNNLDPEKIYISPFVTLTKLVTQQKSDANPRQPTERPIQDDVKKKNTTRVQIVSKPDPITYLVNAYPKHPV